MSVSTEPVSFSVNIIGDRSREQWTGTFRAKVLFSHRDELRRDALRREFIGAANPQFADVRAASIADIFSDLMVRLTDAPTWWKENGNGMDLVDDNVVREVFEKATAPEQQILKDIKDEAEKAAKALKDAKDKDPE